METRLELLDSADGWPQPELRLIGPLLLDIAFAAAPGPLHVMNGSRQVGRPAESTESAQAVVTVPLLAVPRRCRLVLEAEAGTGRVALATIGVEHEGLPPRQPRVPELPRPLLATSVGRSGSTLLMQLLAAHPGIAIDREYPCENTEARKRFAAALDNCQRISRGQWASQYRRPGWEKLLLTTVTSLVRRADEEIGAWYTDLVRRRDGADRLPLYYSEKNLGPAPLVREARPDAREIFLVRDPRDMICSTLAFIAKRGESGFGRQDVESDLDYVRHRAAMARPWVMEPWLARGDEALLVRYEDLVTDGAAALERIFAYLELDSSPALVAGILQQAAAPTDDRDRHMTTASPAASIGRWRRDLPDELNEACAREFAEFIAMFGYAEA